MPFLKEFYTYFFSFPPSQMRPGLDTGMRLAIVFKPMNEVGTTPAKCPSTISRRTWASLLFFHLCPEPEAWSPSTGGDDKEQILALKCRHPDGSASRPPARLQTMAHFPALHCQNTVKWKYCCAVKSTAFGHRFEVEIHRARIFGELICCTMS